MNRHQLKSILLIFLLTTTGVRLHSQTCSSLSQSERFNLPRHFTILTDTRNPCDWGAPAVGTVGRDIYYQVVLPDTMNLLIHTLGSSVYGTEIYFYPDTAANVNRSIPTSFYQSFLEDEGLWDDDNYTLSQDCYVLLGLPKGTYTFTVHGISVSNASIVNGPTTTTVISWKDGDILQLLPPPQPVEGMSTLPKELGSFNTDFICSDTVPSSLYANSFGNSGADVYYHFSLEEEMQLSLDFDNDTICAHLFDNDGWELYRWYQPITWDNGCYLQSGNYRLVVEEIYDSQPLELAFRMEGRTVNFDEPQQSAAAETPTGENYIIHRLYTNANGGQYIEETTFYDGIGRPVEVEQVGASPGGGDLVSLQTYNLSGLPSQEWKSTSFSNNNGDFVAPSSFVSQATLNDSNPYTLHEYEPSPLAREITLTGVGNAWHSANKDVQTAYLINAGSANIVRRYSISADGNYLQLAGNAGQGAYSGVRTTDEDGHTLEVYKDILGNTVLERRNDGTQNLDTYYVYDSYNQLRVVLPPMASNDLAASNGYWSLNNEETLQQYAYTYKYDTHGRVSHKRLPGCDWVHFWYDKQGRLAFSQDGEQNKSSICSFYIYDNMQREVMRGECDEDMTTDSDLNENLAAYTGTGPFAGYEVNASISSLSSLMTHLSSVSFYDTYDFLSLLTNSSNMQSDASDATSQQIWKNGTSLPFARGLLTGQLSEKLPTVNNAPIPFATGWENAAILTAFYYDVEGRIVQQHSTNHLGGYDHIFTSYDFVGNIISQKVTHTSPSLSQPLSFIQNHTYDSWGRPLTTTLSYNGAEPVTIVSNTYDDLGRLSQTTRNSQSGLTTQYAYNIRDWVTQIASPVFVENLHYNTSNNGSTPQWGGNISSEEWKAGDDFTLNKLRSYNFAYDGVDRLLSAAYFENAIPKGRYTTQYSYDQMGNILTLKRYGLTDDGGFGLLDDLSYDYSGNQLVKVTDSNIDEPTYVHAMHFTDGADEDVEYEYNANGSLTADLNKGITGITYNAIGLPEIIMWNINKSLSFAYAADGRKLRRTYFYWRNANLHGGGSHLMPPVRPTIRTTDYCGPFIYETSALQDTHLSKVLFDGGYITPKIDGTAEYHFYVKDHLGNIRAVVNQNDSIEEINHYYPYGSLFGESAGLSNETQPYKYTGKELDRMHGLDMHDHGARWSDTNLGRWWKVDPKAEYFYDTSPYVLCGNNSLKYMDNDGRKIVIWYKDKSGNDQSFIFSGFHGKSLKIPNNQFIKDVIKAYLYNTKNGGGDNIKKAVLSPDITIHVIQGENTEFDSGRKQVISWESRKGLYTTEGGSQSPATRLEHEFDHAVDNINNHKKHQQRRESKNSQYNNDEEMRVINGSERKTASMNKESVRYNHKGSTYDVDDPTSTNPLKTQYDE